MNGLPSVNGLRHQITLQNRLSANDGFGQEQQTWIDVANCFAQVEAASGMSEVSGSAEASPVKYVMFIRYRAGVSARMRLIYAGKVFEIDSVMDLDERHKWLQIDCTQGLTVG